jgi:hypothetical protein
MAKWEASFYTAVEATDNEMGPLVPGQIYVLAPSTDCFFKVAATGAGGAASSAAGSHLCKAGGEKEIMTNDADMFIHVIRDTADGKATASKVSL